jgi:hypothetical protein
MIPSYDSNHIDEALADPAFVQAMKAAKEKQQLQQLDGIVETKESVAKERKGLPKYALDPKLPKVRTVCIPVGHPHWSSLVVPVSRHHFIPSLAACSFCSCQRWS